MKDVSSIVSGNGLHVKFVLTGPVFMKKYRNYISAVCATCILFLLPIIPAFGQSTGAIQGTVVDASGAPVPNASVRVHNETTG
jgi:hypothetical protein